LHLISFKKLSYFAFFAKELSKVFGAKVKKIEFAKLMPNITVQFAHKVFFSGS
jgi:hypothetical protein